MLYNEGTLMFLHLIMDCVFMCRYDPRKRLTAAQALEHE